MRALIPLLLWASLASAWTSAGWYGPFKVTSIEPGFSKSNGNYTLQFYHDGWVAAGACGGGTVGETKLFLKEGLTDFGLQQAKAWTAGLMTAFYKNANIQVYYTGTGCEASGIIIKN